MSTGSSSIRGARVGSSPMRHMGSETAFVDRIQVSYWDEHGNETVRFYAADIAEEDIPETIDSPKSGLPAGRVKENPPTIETNEPFKTHLAYVKERRTEDEAKELLADAVKKYRARLGRE